MIACAAITSSRTSTQAKLAFLCILTSSSSFNDYNIMVPIATTTNNTADQTVEDLAKLKVEDKTGGGRNEEEDEDDDDEGENDGGEGADAGGKLESGSSLSIPPRN